MKKISVVITGASGFIGSSLVEKLRLNEKFEVIPVSRSPGEESNFVVRDYKNTPHGDVLIHLAENSNKSIINSASKEYINSSKKTLEALISKKYSQIIYFSSSLVYGEKNLGPFKEEFKTYRNDNYTDLKLSNEDKVISAGGMVIRLANVIGPKMSSKNVLSDILRQIKCSNSVSLINGSAVRDFIFIGDVVNAIEKLLYKNLSGVFNLGSGVGTSINHLAELMIREHSKKIDFNSNSNSSLNSYNVLDTSKLKLLI